ncbi:hypothetical protein GCM10025862_10440 [Arsenicicoccus piscis]|uniref:Uncharacterized protein n=1 Tax=Arsenicicoccus piscis TaxID=673954 RepID=A0ABQ6HLS1_9MICO|nr:hypothetical protein GCM10025862_10440 [Arsenicicoccus piscis]
MPAPAKRVERRIRTPPRPGQEPAGRRAEAHARVERQRGELSLRAHLHQALVDHHVDLVDRHVEHDGDLTGGHLDTAPGALQRRRAPASDQLQPVADASVPGPAGEVRTVARLRVGHGRVRGQADRPVDDPDVVGDAQRPHPAVQGTAHPRIQNMIVGWPSRSVKTVGA